MSADPYGVSAAHTSVPRDDRLRADPLATAHLIVAETHAEPTRRLLRQVIELGNPVELIHGAGSSPERGIRATPFATDEAAVRILTSWLRDASTGLRLYVSGSERFIRLIVSCAVGAGLSEAEILTEIVGSRSRRVICMHCKTITEGV